MNRFKPSDVWSAVGRAVQRINEDDLDLFRHDVHEVSIAHRLAVYLEGEFTGFNVDLEYNREGKSQRPKKLDGATNCVRPDVIVHRRTENCNLLILELRKNMGICGPATLELEERVGSFCTEKGYLFGAVMDCTERGLEIKHKQPRDCGERP